MFILPFLSKKLKLKPAPSGIKPTALLILDGWGIAPPSDGNAISQANTPNMDKLFSQYPYGELIASGESVGLPANEVGNSEVGHLTIGVGRAIFQSLKRINLEIQEKTFFENRAFLQAAAHVKKYNSKLHIMGLVSSGSVHSSIEHFYALLDFCKKNELTGVCLHLFTDGRDAPPQDGAVVIGKIEERLKALRVGKIASISGRYYAMDRDLRWARTQKAYEAIVLGRGIQANSADEAMRMSYAKNKTDEFIEPMVIMKKQEVRNKNQESRIGDQGMGQVQMEPVGTVDDNDAVLFFNFRVDRPRQLTMAFVLKDFEKLESFEFEGDPHHSQKEGAVFSGRTFKREKWPKNLFFVTMTEYKKDLPVSAIAYSPLKAETSLPKVLSEHNLNQLHLTESEKVRMVTIYFDGLHEGKFPGEDVLIVPSPKVATYDKKPEMSVYEVVREFKKALTKGKHHFYVSNFANPDMVAHSGNIEATIKAIEHVDKAIGELTAAVLAAGGTLFITADHGNAEELLTFPTSSFFFTTSKGDVNTDHSNNPVPFLIINKSLSGKSMKLPKGTLSDVAPTILTWMGLPVPGAMTGKNLLEIVQNKPPESVPADTKAPVATTFKRANTDIPPSI